VRISVPCESEQPLMELAGLEPGRRGPALRDKRKRETRAVALDARERRGATTSKRNPFLSAGTAAAGGARPGLRGRRGCFHAKETEPTLGGVVTGDGDV
jgi:hypothetical protein